jgi:acylphosphatase
MKRHFTIVVSGSVQGVFFRASTKEKADSLNIAGLVRNEPDGSVYIEAEGEEDLLQEFTRWCRKGPARAHVQKADVKENVPKGHSGFVIQR